MAAFYVTIEEGDYIGLAMAVLNQMPYLVLSVIAFHLLLLLYGMYGLGGTARESLGRAWFWPISRGRLLIWGLCLGTGICCNELLAVMLKRCFSTHIRPSSGAMDRFGEAGMPSSHAQFAAFVMLFVGLEMPVSWSRYLLLAIWSLAICYSRYLYVQHDESLNLLTDAMARLYLEYHYIDQLLVGYLIGAIHAVIYYYGLCQRLCRAANVPKTITS